MHRGDHDVELRQAVVGQVHRAVGADVALDAGQQRDAVQFVVQRAHGRRMGECATLVEAVGHGQRLAVVGDGQIGQAGLARRQRHRANRVLAVGRGRVAVEVAAQVVAFHQQRQPPVARGLEFAALLAQFGRNPRQAERFVDAGFGVAGDACVVLDAEQAVLVQLQALPQRRDRATRCCAPCCR